MAAPHNCLRYQPPKRTTYHPKELPKFLNFVLRVMQQINISFCFTTSMECYQFASTFSGKPKDFFCLEKYKVAVGKDYKRIIFYLCSEADFRNYEKMLEGKDSDVEVDSGPEDLHEQHFTDQFFAQQFMADDGNDGSDSIFTVPFSFTSATSSTSTFTSNLISTTSSTATSSSTSAQAASIRDYKDIVKILGSKVNHADEFYLVIRRGTQFIRLLRLWRRQSLKSKPTNIVRVHYSGEDGIDSGAIALELFEHCMTEMGKVMFPNGSPINSSLYVQNGDLRTCGEIAAASTIYLFLLFNSGICILVGAIALEFFEHCMTEMGKVMFPNGSPINSSLYVQNGDLRTCGEIAAASTIYLFLLFNSGICILVGGTLENQHIC